MRLSSTPSALRSRRGTGSDPSLGPKRQGRHTRLLGDPRGHIKGAYLLDHKRMRTFVVPRGTPLEDAGRDAGFLFDTNVRCRGS